MNANRSKNRVTPYYDSPDLKSKSSAPPVVLPEPQPVPVGPIAKREAFSEAVAESIQLLRTLLRHPDSKIAMGAAQSLLNMQHTLLRHGGNMMGTVMPDHVNSLEPLEHLTNARYGEGPTEEEFDAMSEQELEVRKQCLDTIQQQMQRQADMRGLGEFISTAQVQYEYDRCRIREQCRLQFPNGTPPPADQPHPPASHPHWV